MQNFNRYIAYSSIVAEITHVFCCGIPMAFSILSFLTSAGLLVTMPAAIDSLHHAIHDYEIPMICVSAVLIAFGWIFYFISKRLDCRTDGDCSHAPCAPKKKRSNRILSIATILFVINFVGYFALHY